MATVIVVGEHDEGTLKQVRMQADCPENLHVRLMADGHLGYGMPIGGVTVTDRWLAPGGAGFDIGCGNWTGRTGLRIEDLTRADLEEIGHNITKVIAFGKGIGFGTFADAPILQDWIDATRHIGIPAQTVINQFGSVGAGNHYIDLMVDEEGWIWIAMHYGSRKLGHSVADYYLKELGAKDGMYSTPVFLDAETELGQQYLADMQVAGEYAMLSRRLVGMKIATQVLHDTVHEVVENHHNYIWEEYHFGEKFFVTRKGATPVHPDVPAFIGGSMGTDSVIVAAEDCFDNDILFQSAPHGAGRLIGRSQAKGKWDRRNKTWKREPKVTQEMMDAWVEEFGVVRIGGGVDESPHVYRNLVEDVLPYYPWLKVQHLLRPVLAVMAPPDQYGR